MCGPWRPSRATRNRDGIVALIIVALAMAAVATIGIAGATALDEGQPRPVPAAILNGPHSGSMLATAPTEIVASWRRGGTGTLAVPTLANGDSLLGPNPRVSSVNVVLLGGVFRPRDPLRAAVLRIRALSTPLNLLASGGDRGIRLSFSAKGADAVSRVVPPEGVETLHFQTPRRDEAPAWPPATPASSSWIINVAGAWGVVALVFGLLVFAGVPLVVVAARGQGSSAAVVCAASVATSMLVVGALHYVMPGNTLSWLLVGLAITGLAITAWWVIRNLRRSPAKHLIYRSISWSQDVLLGLGVMLPFAALAATFNWWNIGYLQSDVFDYVLSAATGQTSALPNAPMDFGNGLRATDLSVRATLGGLLGIPDRAVVQAAALALLVLTTALASRIGRACRLMLPARVGLILLPVILAGPVGLWTEGYLSRWVFAVLTLTVLFSAALAFVHERGAWLAVATGSGATLALVPPYGVAILPLAIGTLVVAWRRNEVAASRGTLTVGTLWVGALTVANSVWLRDWEVAKGYVGSTLDQILDNFVLPQTAYTAEFAGVLLGLLPWHGSANSFSGLSENTPWPAAVLADYRVARIALAFAVLFVVASFLLAGWPTKSAVRQRRQLPLWLRLCVLTACGLAAAFPLVFVAASDKYTRVMAFVTLAPLAVGTVVLSLLMIAGSEKARDTRRGRWVSITATTTILVLLIGNSASSVSEVAHWFDKPGSAFGQRSSWWIAQVAQAGTEAAERTSARSFAIAASGIGGSYSQRQLRSAAFIALSDHGLTCTNCVPQGPDVRVLNTARPRDGQITVRLFAECKTSERSLVLWSGPVSYCVKAN